MGIDKIKCDRTEIETKIRQCCDELCIKCEKILDKENLIQFNLSKNNLEGLLRVYITKKGIKFDESLFKDRILYSEFEDYIKNILDKTESRKYSFKKKSKKTFDIIYEEIENLRDDDISIHNKENKDVNKTHFFEIKNNNTHEKIVISKFTNGTLLLDGIDWLLWEDVCNIIDKHINSTPLDIFDRFLETKKVETEEINSKYKTNDYTSEEEYLREKLTDTVYMYLDEHFRNYLISSQRLIESEIVLPEYSPILCPAAKVLEGYLKRLLVDLGIEKYENIENISETGSRSKWNFGHVFSGTECIINTKKGSITKEQETSLIEIYSNVIDFRHNQNHGSLNPTKVYIDRDKCVEKFNEVMDIIKVSYYNIKV